MKAVIIIILIALVIGVFAMLNPFEGNIVSDGYNAIATHEIWYP